VARYGHAVDTATAIADETSSALPVACMWFSSSRRPIGWSFSEARCRCWLGGGQLRFGGL
jgi:hypothetical protein